MKLGIVDGWLDKEAFLRACEGKVDRAYFDLFDHKRILVVTAFAGDRRYVIPVRLSRTCPNPLETIDVMHAAQCVRLTLSLIEENLPEPSHASPSIAAG